MFVYIASTVRYLKMDYYTVGSTVDLRSELAMYNEARPDEDEYFYVFVAECADPGAVERYVARGRQQLSPGQGIYRACYSELLHCVKDGLKLVEGTVKRSDAPNATARRVNRNEIVRSAGELLDEIDLSGVMTRAKKLFICNPETAIWESVYDIQAEKFLTDTVRREVADLSPKEQELLDTNWFREKLHAAIYRGIEEMPDPPDGMFALRNTVVVDGRLRDIAREDYVVTHTGWDYIAASDAARDELADFLKKLFPVERERERVLRFLADVVGGTRAGVLVLRGKGDNGKSTFLLFLQLFFGQYKSSCRHACERFGGKRVITSAYLDEDVVEALAPQWPAVVVIKDGAPYHGAFAEVRCFEVPMRSTFLSKRELSDLGFATDDWKSLTFVADNEIDFRFPLWCSAFLDLLLRQKDSTLDASGVPLNPLSSWLESAVVLVADPAVCVSLHDLRSKYAAQLSWSNDHAKEWFLSKGRAVVPRHTWREPGGARKEMRNALLGVKMAAHF